MMKQLLSLALSIMLLLTMAGCQGKGRSSLPSATPTKTPLVDDNVCGVTSTERLQSIFGYDLYWYRHWTGPMLSKKQHTYEDGYLCYLNSNGSPYGSLDISYGPNDILSDADLGSDPHFDEIPSRFPTASAVTLEGHDGVGWGWFTEVDYNIAWKYPNGEFLYTRIIVEEREPREREQKGLQTLLAEVVDSVPVQASQRPGTEVAKGR